MTEAFTTRIDGGDVAVLTFDLPGRSMNVLDEAGIKSLSAEVEAALANDAVKGIVITSGKPDMGGGVDLNMLAEIRLKAEAAGGNPAEALFGFVMALHGVYRRIETGGKPVAVATPGTALGGVFELLLAGHRRFAADNPKAKLGLPEVMVGVFPGAGGTTRLVRMLGLLGAAPLLLEGKLLDPKKAKANMVIDEIVPADELVRKAVDWARAATPADAVKPWDAKGFKFPGGAPYTPQGMPNFLGGAAMTHGKTAGVMPQVNAMLSAIYEGAMVPMDAALRIEARWFTHVLMDPRSSAMIRSLFINKQAIEKGANRPTGVPDMKTKKLGVLGAGMMGAGVAYVSANAGIEVVLIDRDQAAADKGKATIAGLLEESVSKKRMTKEAAEAVLARVTATPDYAALKGCDFVIEAVFEDPKIKAEATQKAEAHLAPDAIFATNTSTLPISGLAKASRDAKNFIGVHFFSPVHKMNLVEIIKGEKTGDAAVAKALDYVRQIRKTPIVVNDARFFYANRCIIPYLNEGIRMVAEGVEPALIDNAAKNAGMPVGPLQLTDETSLELGLKIATATKAAMGAAYPASPADDVLEELAGKRGRLGRKSKSGFYVYDEAGKRQGIWPELRQLWPPKADQPAAQEVTNRLLLIQALEAVRALEEGVLTDIREGDVGAIMGWGFAPWSGGPFSWLDLMGAKKAVALCDELTAKFGERFTAPKILRDLAAKGESFYGRFAPQEKAAA
ncbi:3-hydroxyacyl-CoA dehydrogenase NAD-binding domain-containing protein [Neomegalonema perideroedes]|uniref:3-hydroxyacyl-CoA dehydrogenase NAD-binding domain-containing protein n=1 Tax=Neomegalonema perideroedes TaxID=217219 RepID=UPI00037B01EE|nr:3-hydroxyacyl-CoA dehydrogenase NAD-binding domain-containing protein [Neomegalonema perideroedes]